ncbi:MAG: cytochrome c [Gammaproteobacteria bacterium]|nr:cytochrome c [Gammaproteobacteria bacterium]
MRLTTHRSPLARAMFGLVLASMVSLPVNSTAADAAPTQNQAYLEQVVGVLRSHVLSMRMILDHDDLKYADNMVRHAEAFERTFGMIGPMEWHIAEAFSHAQKTDAADKLNQAQFEQLAEQSRLAIEKIKRSAKRYVRDKNEALMRASINDMIKSCGACHSKLPAGTVPRVWKGMKE